MKSKLTIMMLLLISLALCYIELKSGMYDLSFSQMLTIINDPKHNYYLALVEYRLPRVLLAFFLSVALALSGVLVQSVIRNPLASPEILGIIIMQQDYSPCYYCHSCLILVFIQSRL